MHRHVRFKRHLRFLQEGELIRVVRDLDDEASLPAGRAFEELLVVLSDAPTKERARAELAQRLDVPPAMIDRLMDRLSALKLIEHFDPKTSCDVRFDRQLLLFDALEPVSDHLGSLARQRRLADAQVLILGMGGIGHQMAQSLAAAGIGSLVLVDGDLVEESNLHRQILFGASDTGRAKVEAARDGILRIAPGCKVIVHEMFVSTAAAWNALMNAQPGVRHIVLSADKPVQLVNWISEARIAFNYHVIKCGYMSTQGLIGPLLGPDTRSYEELFSSWGDLIDAQPENIAAFNARSIAPTMAASNAIMANIAALELIKHITRAGSLNLREQRLLLDLNDYSTRFG